ncbi:MAG TPA: class I SAM-dependent methyltransferase [Candidatus Paceibacterota bacterium]|jgi:ubiquinone/menaquinone biosynthesis C-methylase UbiE|nr:class I SAM-dependent methyltransferase [Candidatus Paceibacterota bacterium]HOX91149.1 class I SAM-dependent methyltransferase [Candidatus Paceibacterota bacterium]HPI66591.1 class I SAM-dependent methyltransferase [Candidatus Paceibacterota bacterium]HQC46261.1 class I SAM-dependent methyltransferase [Candidatus Paceibacterota bacterium]HQO70884.1 class I SAM-dependent methyltransferase [Candidatus Paceibacterota bacterium]
MDYQKHKEYFETAYRTGSDIWTHLSMKNRGAMLMEKLQPGALILDVGSGRGLVAKKLAESGFSVIGLDFEKEIVKKTNGLVKDWGLEGKLKFVEGDALDIPFVDNSFDGVCDFGLMENLYKEDWEKYASEVCRVLKPGGYYLNTSLSKETQEFLGFRPKGSPGGDLEKYDLVYHFFGTDEIKNIFDHNLNPIEQDIKFVDHPNEVALVETLFQKKDNSNCQKVDENN